MPMEAVKVGTFNTGIEVEDEDHINEMNIEFNSNINV